MGEDLITRRLNRVRDLLDDLDKVTDDETVDEFNERIDDLEYDLKEAFRHD